MGCGTFSTIGKKINSAKTHNSNKNYLVEQIELSTKLQYTSFILKTKNVLTYHL